MIPKYVEKTWGWEFWFSNVQEENVNYCGKLLFVDYGKWSSNHKFHYHKIKDESFLILEGELKLDYIENSEIYTINLGPLQAFRIRPGMKHRFTSNTETGCRFIEVSTFHSDEDSYRCDE